MKRLCVATGFLFLFLVFALGAYAQQPIPKLGSGCPRGWIITGEFCKPGPRATEVIQPNNKKCPPNYIFDPSSQYCFRTR